MKKTLTVLIFSLFGTCLPAEGDNEYFTGTQLYDICTKTSDAEYSEEFCKGFILGAVDGYLFHQDTAKTVLSYVHKIDFEDWLCLPENIEDEALLSIVVGWLEQNVPLRRLRATALISLALEKSYPCSQN